MNRFQLIFLLFLCASLFSCDSVLERKLEDKKATLLSPSNNLSSSVEDQKFFWATMQGATKYQLQIVSPSFDNITKLVIDSTVATNYLVTILSPGVYQWRVRALNESSASQFSDPWRLLLQ